MLATYSGGDSKLLLFTTSFELRRLHRAGKSRLNVRHAWIRLLIHFSLPFLGPSTQCKSEMQLYVQQLFPEEREKTRGVSLHTQGSLRERARDLIAEPLTELVKAERSVICIQAEVSAH